MQLLLPKDLLRKGDAAYMPYLEIYPAFGLAAVGLLKDGSSVRGSAERKIAHIAAVFAP
jgi:hypothetical protein